MNAACHRAFQLTREFAFHAFLPPLRMIAQLSINF